MQKYNFREATIKDCYELRKLFRGTIRSVNCIDYAEAEIEDWASCGDQMERWEELIDSRYFIVALNERGKIIGFSSITSEGYLHSMFVHKDYQRQEVASFLLTTILRYAHEKNINLITSEVSITARPFFEKNGFKVTEQQERKANRLFLRNYNMERVI